MIDIRDDLLKTMSGMLHNALLLGSGMMLVTTERALSGAITLLNPLRVRRKAADNGGLTNGAASTGLETFLRQYFLAEGLGRRFSSAGFVLVRGGKVTLEARFDRLNEEIHPLETCELPLRGAESITGALPTTAPDMGGLMIGLLNNSGARALSGSGFSSRRANFRQRFLQHPAPGGPLYEFLQTTSNGRRALCHLGGRDHRSLLYLLPEEGTGFYIVVEGGDEQTRFRVTTRLAQRLMDRMFPEPASWTNRN